MDFFNYKSGELHAENVALREIASSVGTPLYCYSESTIRRHYEVFDGAFKGLNHMTCYAAKANSNLTVLGILAQEGSGVDVVSGGEITRSLRAGIKPDKIIFSGVGKTLEEIEYAAREGIFQINAESTPELDLIEMAGAAMGREIPVAIRINPDVEPNTHGKINTGKKESKFGVAFHRAREAINRCLHSRHIKFQGLSVHIGSQITDFHAFALAFEKIALLVVELKKDGIELETLDLGGGIGIRYGLEDHPNLDGYVAIVRSMFRDFKGLFIFEPGRVIVGNSGILVSSVIRVKDEGHRRFLVLDSGMNDLVRPSMYGAYHEIIPVMEPEANAVREEIDIVGPVCETGDIFAAQRATHPLKAGELAAIRGAGAYGAVMSSFYNTRPLIPEILVNGDSWRIIRRRIGVDEMLSWEG